MKISKAHKGKKVSEETKRKLSESRLGRFTGKDNPFYGRHHTDELKKEQSRRVSKPVIGVNVKTGESIRFDSVLLASKFIQSFMGGNNNTYAGRISWVLNHVKNGTAYGYYWVYVEKGSTTIPTGSTS